MNIVHAFRSREVKLGFPLLALAGSLCLTALPARAATPAGRTAAPVREYTIEQFLSTNSLRNASFSHDESRILFSSNEGGIWNVYSVPVKGGEPTPVTTSTTDNNYAVSYFPADDRILYTRDRAGDENNHLYVRERDGREKDLTPGEKLKAEFGGWTHEGDAFYLRTNERDARFFDVYRVSASGYERTLVYQDTAGYQARDISPDRRWITLEKTSARTDIDLYLRDNQTGETKRINQNDGVAVFTSSGFDPDSRWLYYLTDEGTEFKRLSRYELSSGKHEDVDKPAWDVSSSTVSHKGRYRVTATNQDASTVIRVWDMRTGKEVPLPELPEGDITSIVVSRSESRIAFYVNGDRSPNDLFVYSFGETSPSQLTHSLGKDLRGDDLVESEIIRFASFDGMQIPCVLYRPKEADAARRAPAIVWVHGGPGDQTRKGYSAILQYLVNHGYVILGINNRGSSGYGKTFFTADDGKHGREPLWDCVAGEKYLAGLPYVDPERIAIAGGSYGGYMVLAALAYQPDAFRAGVDLFGVSNWIRTLESIPPYWEAMRKALYQELGDPKTEQDKLREISPLFAADRIRKPLLVLQGRNDPRVLQKESDDIVEAVKKNGVPVEYIVFEDEGHGFAKKKNQARGYGAMLAFLDRHVKGTTGASALEAPVGAAAGKTP